MRWLAHDHTGRGPTQTIFRVSPTWNFSERQFFNRRKNFTDGCTLVYLGKDLSTLPPWLCREEPDKLVDRFKLVKYGRKLMWKLQQYRQDLELLFKYKVEWTRKIKDKVQEESSVGISDDYSNDAHPSDDCSSDNNHMQKNLDLDLGNISKTTLYNILDRTVDDLQDNSADYEFSDSSEGVSEHYLFR
jgi:hypothetical protein